MADLEPIAKRRVADALLSLGLNKNISIEEMNDKDLNVEIVSMKVIVGRVRSVERLNACINPML